MKGQMKDHMKLPAPVAGFIEIALNRALQLDEHTFNQVVTLQGKVIAIELTGLNIIFYLAPALDGVQVMTEYDNGADTTIRGTPISLLKTAISDDRQTLFKGEVVIDGDMALGQKFQKILDGLEMDWEEPLSQLIGDIAAHQVGEAVRGFAGFAKAAFNSLTMSTAEYFQEETKDVVNPVELERFTDKIDVLRADTDRLDARFQKIKATIKEKVEEN
ncbi:MAG: SCP2 sterol-binding domain-containing protein [Gammaproteobacteria bacterium]|nr:SCP2 sterol-binding domain-containing protein [Gammaproteobacteria bacterium]